MHNRPGKPTAFSPAPLAALGDVRSPSTWISSFLSSARCSPPGPFRLRSRSGGCSPLTRWATFRTISHCKLTRSTTSSRTRRPESCLTHDARTRPYDLERLGATDQSGQNSPGAWGRSPDSTRAQRDGDAHATSPIPSQLDTGAKAFATLDAGVVTDTTPAAARRTGTIDPSLLVSTPGREHDRPVHPG